MNIGTKYITIYNMENIQEQRNLLPHIKVGQKVWCAMYGEGIIRNINSSIRDVISVEFEKRTTTYTKEGKYTPDCLPTLFLEEQKLDYSLPEVFKKGELVWIKCNGYSDWVLKYYYVKLNEAHYCYTNQDKIDSNEPPLTVYAEAVRKFSDCPLPLFKE